jgi:Dehydrogenases with different specificities (related to short-chain alcohol dehydrogenases)
MFTDKVAVVTGGASGIGKIICDELRRNNAKVCIIDIKDNDYFVGDIADEKTLISFADKVKAEYGNIDFFNQQCSAPNGRARRLLL